MRRAIALLALVERDVAIPLLQALRAEARDRGGREWRTVEGEADAALRWLRRGAFEAPNASSP